MKEPIKNRYEFVYLFDVENGNPNGDPDAGNMPRIDPETSHGLITDVCLKRKIRNFVEIAKAGKEHYDIFVKEKAILNQQIERAYTESDKVKDAVAAWQAWKKDKKKHPKPPRHYEDVAGDWMCENFYDIRAFGAVMTTGDEKASEEGGSKLKKTAGQVRGPVQISFSKSADPIVPLEVSITRMAVTNERDLEKERTMGRKHIVPYALYRVEGFVSAPLADRTGFSDADLELLWQALTVMFDHDRSAARGKMSARNLFIFKHESALGNAPAQKLFELVKVVRAGSPEAPPRSYGDYQVSVDSAGVPSGVELQIKL